MDPRDILRGVLGIVSDRVVLSPELRERPGSRRLCLESPPRPIQQRAPRWPRGSQQPMQPRRPLITAERLPGLCECVFQYGLVSRVGGAMQIAGEVAEETQPLCCSANSFRIQVRTVHNEYYRNRMLRRIWSGVNRPRAVKMQGDHGIPGTRTD